MSDVRVTITDQRPVVEIDDLAQAVELAEARTAVSAKAVAVAVQRREELVRVQVVSGGGGGGGGGGGPSIWAKSAEAFGFVKGLGSAAQAANRTAWAAVMAGGGALWFDAGDWDMRSAPIAQLLNGNVSIFGDGSAARIWVGASTYLDIGVGNLFMHNVHFYAPSQLGNSTLIGLDNQNADTDHLLVDHCWFTNLYVAVRSTSTSTLSAVNPYTIDQLRMNRNTVRGIGGLSRIGTKRGGRVTEYVGNFIDCGASGGIPAGFAGIYHGFVANTGLVLSPEDVGENARFDGNIVRNIKPLANPRSAGAYGIITNCPGAKITNNTIDKCYLFYGAFASTCSLTTDSNVLTAVGNISRVRVGQGVEEGVGITAGGIPTGAVVTAVNVGAGTVTISANVTRATASDVAITFTSVTEEEVMFTGNGSATTFSGTLTRHPTPDSLKIVTGGATVADDLDHGWAKGGKSRQKIVSAAGVLLGWIDYNSRQWSLTFPAPPASGAVYTARYFEGLAVDNVEAIYDKSWGGHITGNTCTDCSGRQGVLGVKGGGQTAGVGERQAAGGYGEIVTGNTIANRVQTGVFNSSFGMWLQSDSAKVDGNTFEGLTDRIVRYRPGTGSSEGRQFSFSGNTIRDFYGYRMITMVEPTQNTIIDFNIDGWFYSGGVDYLTALEVRSEDGDQHYNLVVPRALISNRVTAGKPVVIASIRQDTTGHVDLTIERVKCRVPWRGVLKTGDGSAGRVRVGPYDPANLLTTAIVTGATVSDDLVFERSGTAILNSSAISEDGGGGAGGIPYALDVGGANLIVLTVTSATITSLVPGLMLNVRVSSTSSTAVTLNLNGLGANPVIANGEPLYPGALKAGQVYQMVFDGTSWQVLGLPDIIESVSGTRGYEVTNRGQIRCWDKIDMGSNSTVTWALPKTLSGWIIVTAFPFSSAAGSDYALDVSLIGKTLNYNVDGDIESIDFVNNTNMFVQLYIEVRGT